MNILPVAATQGALEYQYQKVPREKLNIISSYKEVSTLLIVSATNNKTLSKHAEISEIYVKLEYQKNTIILEAHNNTPYSCYAFIYRIICMQIFEWKWEISGMKRRGKENRGVKKGFGLLKPSVVVETNILFLALMGD